MFKKGFQMGNDSALHLIPNLQIKIPKHKYSVTHLLADLGWVDFNLGCSTGCWAVLQLRCCPNKTVEHPKSKLTQPRSARRWVTLYFTKISYCTYLPLKVHDSGSFFFELFLGLSSSQSMEAAAEVSGSPFRFSPSSSSFLLSRFFCFMRRRETLDFFTWNVSVASSEEIRHI